MSPSLALSIAMRMTASALLWNMVSARMLALLRESGGRPAGFSALTFFESHPGTFWLYIQAAQPGATVWRCRESLLKRDCPAIRRRTPMEVVACPYKRTDLASLPVWSP
jgi:hypothetical protein